MDINNWISMFESDDEDVVYRTCENGSIINHYLSGITSDRIKYTDSVLINELNDFNEYALKVTGKPVFNSKADSLFKEVGPVADYLLAKGLSRSG